MLQSPDVREGAAADFERRRGHLHHHPGLLLPAGYRADQESTRLAGGAVRGEEGGEGEDPGAADPVRPHLSLALP